MQLSRQAVQQGSGGADGPNSNKGSRQEPRHPLSKLRFSHPAPNVVTLLTAPGQTYYFKFAILQLRYTHENSESKKIMTSKKKDNPPGASKGEKVKDGEGRREVDRRGGRREGRQEEEGSSESKI